MEKVPVFVPSSRRRSSKVLGILRVIGNPLCHANELGWGRFLGGPGRAGPLQRLTTGLKLGIRGQPEAQEGRRGSLSFLVTLESEV